METGQELDNLEITEFLTKQSGGNETVESSTQEPTTEVTDPIAEAVVEQTTETTTTEQAEETETSFFDTPDLFKEAETTTESTQAVEVPETFKQELETYKAEVERLKKNPLVDALEKYGMLEEFDIKKFAQELIPTDYTKYSLQDLVAEKIKMEYPDLTSEELSSEVEQYLAYKGIDENSSRIVRAEFEKSIRNELQANKPKSDYIAQLEEAAKSLKPVKQEDQLKQVMEVYNADKKVLSDFASQLKGQKVYGLELQEEHINNIQKVYDDLFNPQGVPFTKNDGTFDTKSFTLFAHKVANYEANLKAAYELGKSESLKAKTRVDPLGNTVSTAPAQDTRSIHEIILQDFEN